MGFTADMTEATEDIIDAFGGSFVYHSEANATDTTITAFIDRTEIDEEVGNGYVRHHSAELFMKSSELPDDYSEGDTLTDENGVEYRVNSPFTVDESGLANAYLTIISG